MKSTCSDFMIKAVIFDYNGTLINDLKFLETAYSRAAKKMGVKISREELRRKLEFVTRQRIREIFGWDISEEEKEEIYELVYKYYRELVEKKNIVFRGVPEILDYLSGKYKLGVVSNTRRKKFEEFFPKELAAKFQCSVFSHETENPKPAPDSLIKVAGMLGIPAKECVYLGDSLVDAEAAKAAGMRFILVTKKRDKKLLKECDTVLDDIKELKKVL